MQRIYLRCKDTDLRSSRRTYDDAVITQCNLLMQSPCGEDQLEAWIFKPGSKRTAIGFGYARWLLANWENWERPRSRTHNKVNEGLVLPITPAKRMLSVTSLLLLYLDLHRILVILFASSYWDNEMCLMTGGIGWYRAQLRPRSPVPKWSISETLHVFLMKMQ